MTDLVGGFGSVIHPKFVARIATLEDAQGLATVAKQAEAAVCAYGYLRGLFEACAPQCEPLPDLMGICTQIDNLIAGYRIKLGEMPDPSNVT